MVNDFLPRRPQAGGQPGQPLQPHTPPTTHWERPVSFHSPEAVTYTDPGPLSGMPPPAPNGQGNKTGKRSLKDRLRSLTKKQWILIIAIAVVLLASGGVGAYMLLKGDPAPKKQAVVEKTEEVAEPEPTTVPSKLTGLPVDPANNQRQVTAVMIENSMDARPQSGLANAGVVFEAVAEGGITRFLTLFQDDEPDYVGPVRSVRPYYVQWLRGFDAAVAHVGGSADALAMLKRGEAKDLDQFANSSAYWRVSNRYAPHNMYSSIPKLNEVEARKGYTTSTYTGFSRKTAETPSKAPTAKSIDFNISGAIYNPHYDYDATSNSYRRSEGGAVHLDERSGAQLAPKVVVALVIPQGRNGVYTTYQTIGSGQAYVFQDGIVTIGTWQKTSNEANITFKNADGSELKLNPGQTWLSVVGSADRVTYAP